MEQPMQAKIYDSDLSEEIAAWCEKGFTHQRAVGCQRAVRGVQSA
jgi:hypothetical protein